MRLSLFLITLVASFQVLATSAKGQYIQPDNYTPKVRFETSMGVITVELNRLRAKLTVNNFLSYVARGQYNNTMIHRVEEDYLIQAGAYQTNYTEVEPDKPIFNESGNGLKNDKGTIAMAKLIHDEHSATNQFFFNLNDNDNLNPGNSWGYAVFGEVIEGYDILEAMSQVEVGYSDKLGYPTVPKKMITIIKIVILDES